MRRNKKLIGVILCFLMVMQVAVVPGLVPSTAVFSYAAAQGNGEGNGVFEYLSDIEPSDMVRCNVGWGTYTLDKNLDGNAVSLKTAGSTTKVFKKAVVAHAKADLIFDLGENYLLYDKFTAYAGVDASRGSNGLVKFTFSVSNTPADSSSWTVLKTTGQLRGNSVAEYIDLTINGYRYFRVEISPEGKNEADHSVLADARFYSEDYEQPYVACLKAQKEIGGEITDVDMNEAYFEQLMEEYLTQYTYKQLVTNDETELDVLRYTLVKKCGFDNLMLYLTTGEKYKQRTEMFTWLFNDLDNLREFINGGEPANGNYMSALRILSDLYNTYKDDLSDETPLRKSDDKTKTRADLYKTMMFCMSLVCAGGLQPWMANTAKAVPVNRYAYFQENYVNGKMRDEIFENLVVEEMRWVLGNNISDSEIVWLNDYSDFNKKTSSFPAKYSPHHLISYKWYDYSKDVFYAAEKESEYSTTYRLKYTNEQGETVDYTKYGLTYGLVNGVKVQRVWMVFEDGAVCGNISRTGANLAACYGVPACESGQPGHCAFLIMNRDSAGNFTWGIDNDITGWLQTDNGRRLPCNWGTWCDDMAWINGGYRAAYILLSQAALDDYENYCKAEEILKLYDLCKTNAQREECLRAALSFQDLNLDAWIKLIKLYTGDSTKTVHELADLGTELCSTKMVYQPRPLNDLMQLIINRLSVMKNGATQEQKEAAETEYVATIMRRQSAFYTAAGATAANCTQPGASKLIANNYLKGETQAFATFSFDGADAGKLVFNSNFTSVRFNMCFNYTDDGYNDNDTWTERTVPSADESGRVVYTLTADELSQITAESDIVIRPCGLPESPKNHFTINITQAADLVDNYSATGIYKNDDEDRFLGNVSGLEYSLDGTAWQKLTNDVTFPGECDVWVRYCTTGTMLASKNATKFVFTDNNKNDKYSYISIKRITLADFSTQEASRNDYAKYAIDGIPFTRWHSGWWTNDTQRYITLKLDEPTYLSKISYLAPGTDAPNGTFYKCDVYVSLDGESWYKAASGSFASSNEEQQLQFSSVAYGQYVKLVGVQTQGGYASAKEISLYEDKTFIGRTPETLTIVNTPTKADYVVGERLDLSGIEAICTFDNKSTMKVPYTMLTSDTEVLTKKGLQAVNVQYLDLAPSSFMVNVADNNLTPSSITLDTNMMKTDYYIGEEFEPQGLKITATNGTKIWYPAEKEYTVAVADTVNNALDTVGEKTVSVTYKGVTGTAKITVNALPTINVQTPPAKTTYNLGDSFDTQGMVVTITQNGETTQLPYGAYELDEDELNQFTAESGTDKKLTVYLAGHKNVRTEITGLTVYDYIVMGNFRFEVDGDGSSECSLTLYSGSGEAVVNVPTCVVANGKCYNVTSVGAEAFRQAEDVRQLILPGTLQSIEDGALSGLSQLTALTVTGAALESSDEEIGSLKGLTKLTLTGGEINLDSEVLSSMTALTNIQLADVAAADDVTVEAGTLAENVNGKINVPTTALAQTLNNKYDSTVLNSYVFAAVNREGTVFKITAPNKTEYNLGDNIDADGITAMLENSDGTVEAVPAGDCIFSTTIIDELGDEVKITVTEKTTGLSDTFTIKVNSQAPVFTANLPNTANVGTELNASTSVTAGQTVYQWYYSDDTTYGEDDEKVGQNSPSCPVTKEGYYYVVATQGDIYGNTGKSKRSFVTHTIDPNRIKNTATGEYFTKLSDAFKTVKDGETLVLLYDVYEDASAVLSTAAGTTKNVTVTVPQGKSYTLQRTYAGNIITVNSGCTLDICGVTIDGGAIWGGTKDSTLGRGTSNNGIVGTEPLMVLNANAKINIKDNTVIQNVAATGNEMYGSVLRISRDANKNSVFTIYSGTVQNCSSPSNVCPGALFIFSYGQIVIKDGLFKNNSNTLIYNVSMNASPIEIENGTFINNTGTNGAVIQMGGPATLNVKGGTFKNNKATNGAVIYSWNGGTINISDGLFEGNTAIQGAVFSQRNDSNKVPMLNITGGTFKNNTSTQEGGAIYYNRNEVPTVKNASFTGNSSATNGGAIFCGMGVSIENCTFTDNQAANGDSIYVGNVGDTGTALTVISASQLGEVAVATSRKIVIYCNAFATLGMLDENNRYVLNPEKAVLTKRAGDTGEYTQLSYTHEEACAVSLTDAGVAATCITEGKTEGSHCGVCQKVITAQETIQCAGQHSLGQWVAEKKADCLNNGTKGHYYCSECKKYFDAEGVEIENITIPGGHSFGQWHNEVPAKGCKEKGTKGYYYCSACKKYFDANKKEIKNLDIVVAHTPGAAVRENVVAPTCNSEGSYDTVVYCTVCSTQLSKNHGTTPTTGHTDNDKNGVCDVCGTQYCSCNCHKSGFMGFIWKITNFFNKLFKINPTCSCGKAHY